MSSTASSDSLATSDGSAGASVDEERAPTGADIRFGGGGDPAFDEERVKLAKRISAALGEVTIGGCEFKTRLLARIGGGSFGDVYLGEAVGTGERVAVKIEPATCAFQSLLHEGNVYRKLRTARGIPAVRWYGLHGHEFTAMIMDLMGPTLYDRWVECGERFSLKTVLMLVDQTVEVLERVHASNVVHRDISPNNFMFGAAEEEKGLQVHLIDFGHARELPNAAQFVPARGAQQRFNFARPMVGTPRFASVFAHAGLEPSYRDDMESLGYVWIYLLAGRLPWQGLRPADARRKLELIGKTKMDVPIDKLCENLPGEFAVYMNYVRSLKHLEMPNHAEVREFFRGLAASRGIEYDGRFDWIKEKGRGTNSIVVVDRQTKKSAVNADDDGSNSGSSERVSAKSDTNISK